MGPLSSPDPAQDKTVLPPDLRRPKLRHLVPMMFPRQSFLERKARERAEIPTSKRKMQRNLPAGVLGPRKTPARARELLPNRVRGRVGRNRLGGAFLQSAPPRAPGARRAPNGLRAPSVLQAPSALRTAIHLRTPSVRPKHLAPRRGAGRRFPMSERRRRLVRTNAASHRAPRVTNRRALRSRRWKSLT